MINEANLSAVYDQKVSGSKVAAPRTRKREQTERPIKGAEKRSTHRLTHSVREGMVVGKNARGTGKSDGRVRGLRKSVFDID